jgi:hypothetical protein
VCFVLRHGRLIGALVMHALMAGGITTRGAMIHASMVHTSVIHPVVLCPAMVHVCVIHSVASTRRRGDQASCIEWRGNCTRDGREGGAHRTDELDARQVVIAHRLEIPLIGRERLLPGKQKP